MHRLAHLVPQAAVATQAARASAVGVKPADDGAFAESLRSTLAAASVPSSKVPAVSAQPTQNKQEKREQQNDVEEQVSFAVSAGTPAVSNGAKQKQDTDQATSASATKETAAKVTAAQKTDTKSTKDVAAQYPDAVPVQPAADASKETAQTPQIANAPAVPVTGESSNAEAEKSRSDGATKIDASSASGGATRGAKPEAKKLESAPGATSAPAVATPSPATTATGAVQAIGSRNADGSEGASAGGMGLAVVVHATAAMSSTPVAAAPSVSHTGVVAAAAAPADSPDVQTLVATQKVLEIGVASDSHGWLRVRAQVDSAGEISAAVVAATAGAAEGLHRELPAISAYLAGEQVGVSSLVVHAAGSAAATQDALYGAASGGAGAGAGHGAEKESSQAQRSSLPQLPAAQDGLDEASAMLAMPAAVFANGTGSWLSVRV